MAIRVITPPAAEPITLQEAKDQLRIFHNEEDTLIEHYISAARIDAEASQHRAYITQTIRYTMDNWPSVKKIYLPRSPLQSVTSVEYLDRDGATQTLPAANYTVDTDSEPGRIILNPGETWPTGLYPYSAIQITFIAGYGDRPAVPLNIKQAIMFLTAHYFEHREEIAGSGHIPQRIPGAARDILAKDPIYWTEDLNQ